MGRALTLAILVTATSVAIAGQTPAVLHIRAVVTDANGRATPLPRHALIISDNPPTQEVRRILTGLDGTANVRLRPGNYTVESDQPLLLQGKAYHWRQTLDIVAGRDSDLELTLANAVAEAIAPGTIPTGTTATGTAPTGATPADTPTPSTTDTALQLRQWLDSVVQVWTPTAHASGFLVDTTGLIVTNQRVVGDATSVEVQLSRSNKVVGTVVEADRQRDIAVVRINPTVMASIAPVPLGCPRSSAPRLAREQEIFALAAPLRQQKGWTPGNVSRNDVRTVAVDLSLATGGTGGPVFIASGELVGITTLPDERDEPRRGAIRVVRIDGACEVVEAAAKKAKETAAPSGTLLPVEPTEPAPIDAFKDAVKRRAGSLLPYQMAAAEFDVAFITPVLNFAAQSQTNQNFSNWSEYASDIPPVLFVRVTPKAAESFLAKLARGAAYTQGMALPSLKRLKSGFDRLQAYCGRSEVLPIHPFKLDLRVSETDAISEGFYAFDPAELGPGCGEIKLVLYSEKEGAKPDTRVIDPKTLQQIWRDFDLGKR
jgi:S1-C subfamily serine protease